MRVTRLTLVWMAMVTMGVNAAQAQTNPGDDEGRFYGGIEVAATLGHKSSSSFNVELGAKVIDQLEVFLEAGRMQNVATKALDDRATIVADFITRRGGAAASTTASQTARFFDIGVKYRFPVLTAIPDLGGAWRPYAGLGVGVAKVETVVNFAVNGADVTTQLPALYGLVLGNDLESSLNKTFITVPIGLQWTFRKRFVIDGSYRYGVLLAKPDDIAEDVKITTQRVQIGFLVRF